MLLQRAGGWCEPVNILRKQSPSCDCEIGFRLAVNGRFHVTGTAVKRSGRTECRKFFLKLGGNTDYKNNKFALSKIYLLGLFYCHLIKSGKFP